MALTYLKEDREWAFSDLSKKDTNYVSHGYHKYPAKFIPQLVEKLLIKYSKPKDLVLDCFGGCGTTLVEAKINNRNSIALDINPAAILITRAKRTAINPLILEKYNQNLLNNIAKIKIREDYYAGAHPRLKYWFRKKEYNELIEIFLIIKSIDNKIIKTFYNCCFSNILKNCSIWYSKSIKPMRDFNKKIPIPTHEFIKHLNLMSEKNYEYYEILKSKKLSIFTKVLERDARRTGLKSDSIDLVITSPPYAISYEYADLHQLTLLWFKFTEDINETKKKFIGTMSNIEKREILVSNELIIKKLSRKDKRLARQLNNYFIDLYLSFEEIYRVLKKNKMACIIIGNTQYKNIPINNMDISVRLLKRIGFNIKDVIKRRLSSKIFTPYRDLTGKFTDSSHARKKKIYQYEYIIIAKKQ